VPLITGWFLYEARKDINNSRSGKQTSLRNKSVHEHYLEIRSFHAPELAHKGIVVPSGIRRSADEPAGAVVGNEHAIGLERLEDCLGFRAEICRNDIRGFEPHAHAHGWQIGACVA